MEAVYEAVTIRLADVLGHLKAVRGIQPRWDEDSKRYVIALGGGKKNIPITGSLRRGKGNGKALLSFATLQDTNGIQFSVDQLAEIAESQFEICTVPRLPDELAGVIVRIDLRLPSGAESDGVGGWQCMPPKRKSKRRAWKALPIPKETIPFSLAVARCMNGTRGRKYLCFDGLLLFTEGRQHEIYPQGKTGPRYSLSFTDKELRLIQIVEMDPERRVLRREALKKARLAKRTRQLIALQDPSKDDGFDL